jgi:hypothetical protein
MLFFVILIELAIIGFYVYVGWKLFEKAGQPGWACIIPIYSTIVTLRIVGKPWWWLLLFFIPGVNIVFLIWMLNMLSKSFGKDEGFTVGLVLLGFIFYPILALGDARYLGPFGDPAAWQAAQNPQFDFEQPAPQA